MKKLLITGMACLHLSLSATKWNVLNTTQKENDSACESNQNCELIPHEKIIEKNGDLNPILLFALNCHEYTSDEVKKQAMLLNFYKPSDTERVYFSDGSQHVNARGILNMKFKQGCNAPGCKTMAEIFKKIEDDINQGYSKENLERKKQHQQKIKIEYQNLINKYKTAKNTCNCNCSNQK